MANKRVSELVQITAADLIGADLFLLADVSAQESKKLTLSDLSEYLLSGGNISGSFFGTASWAQIAVLALTANSATSASYSSTASFALNGGSSSPPASASWASQSLSASYAASASFVSIVNAATASFATSSKFASSASFLIYTGGNNGTAFNAINATTAATASSASFSSVANTASFSNTSSYANTSSVALNSANATSASIAAFALTASVGITTNVQTSASWASQSLSSSYSDFAAEASTAITASYVIPNLTLQQEGIFLAITQSNYLSQLDAVDLSPFFTTPATTSVEAVGTVVAPYTSSILLNESVTLYVLNRATGITYTVDSTPVYVNIQGQYSSISASIQASLAGQLSGSITGSAQGTFAGTASGSISGSLVGGFTGSISGSNANGTITGSFSGSYNSALTSASLTASITSSINANYNGLVTGSISGSVSTFLSGAIKFPFTLMGQLYLQTGSYMFFLSASTTNIFIEPSRLSRFNISSNVGQFNVHNGEPLQLTTTNPADLIKFSSSLGGGGPFTDTAAHIVQSGSANCLAMDISNVGSIRYIWTLPNLTNLVSFGNTLVTDVGGMPNSIVTMSLQSGSLNQLYPLSQSAVSILNFANNNVASFPPVPLTMSYINCNNNPVLSLPAIPFGVTQLYAAGTSITNPPPSFNNQIVSMSFANSSNLNLWLTTLPSALSSFDVSNCTLLTALPTIPANVMYLNVSFGGFTAVAEDNICANLVSNGLNSGSLNLLGNAALLPTTLTRIATLQSRAWTVTY